MPTKCFSSSRRKAKKKEKERKLNSTIRERTTKQETKLENDFILFVD